ncbi:DASH complex subunit dad4 [Purpureocillium lilacinum]|uniref:DASH complex subunit DAD4 n=1 Tax=Purpureocillium lilacinum TaxID=33203 RepID=A0A2U3E7D3_PURLI|nr:hypothetical protein Purlil1_11557 [Purpureocillium lilacinum]PWI70421.1 DASH complex subunit dad4 [Purpureocillium lilacinum]
MESPHEHQQNLLLSRIITNVEKLNEAVVVMNKSLQEINIQNMNVELVAQMFKNYQSNVLFHLEALPPIHTRDVLAAMLVRAPPIASLDPPPRPLSRRQPRSLAAPYFAPFTSVPVPPASNAPSRSASQSIGCDPDPPVAVVCFTMRV